MALLASQLLPRRHHLDLDSRGRPGLRAWARMSMHGLDAVLVPGPGTGTCNRSSLASAIRAQVFERSEGRSSFSESLKLSLCSELVSTPRCVSFPGHASPMVRAGSGQLPGAQTKRERPILLKQPRVARPGAEQDPPDTEHPTLCSVCPGGSHGRRLCLRDVRDPCGGPQSSKP